MKTIHLAAVCLTLALPLFADPAPPPQVAPPMTYDRIETVSGKVYEQVTVRKVDPDGLSIMHAAGAKKILFSDLSKEMQEAYGYNPEAAAAYRAASDATAAQTEAAILTEEQAQAKRKSDHASSAKSAEADKALRDRVKGMARQVTVEGYQISSIGVLANIRVMKPVKMTVPGSMIQRKNVWVFDAKEDGVIRGAKGVKAGESVDMTGRPYGLKDFTTIRISWEGLAWRIGFVRYKTQQGLLRTCPLFTASEDEAVAFFGKHGFTKAAVDAVRTED